ncbi:PEGA domain-containing protein [Lachnospiraceae bacterium C7]|nr:PEGA domain-containing protein [Lachnospiraceae bacterium C7]
MKKFIGCALCVGALGLLCSCGDKANAQKISFGTQYYSSDDTEEEDVEDTEIESKKKDKEKTNGKADYVVIEVNTEDEIIRLYNKTKDLEYQFYYSLDTKILNRHGKNTSMGSISAGKIVNISGITADGKVGEIQISPNVWDYSDIKRYELDTDKKTLVVGDTKYRYTKKTQVFSENENISPKDIGEDDELEIVGKGKEILSIVVTTGHGTLSLKNTSLFEGSFLQLDNRAFVNITPNMVMDVPEGEYTLAVANNGWGGSKKIEIKRGQTTEVNLDELKGNGPSYGKVLFAPDVVGAKILIDGKQIDFANPVSIQYGRHSLKIIADGYKTMNKILYVNSPEGTITINMEKANEGSNNSSSGEDSGDLTSSTPKNHSEVEAQRNSRESSEANSITTNGSGNSGNNGESTSTANGNDNKTSENKTNSTSSGSGTNTNKNSVTTNQLKDYISTLSNLLNNSAN